MRRSAVFLLVAALVALTTGLGAAEVKLDHSHTKVQFTVSHLVVSSVTGRFRAFEGSADFDARSGTLSNVQVTIRTESIDTANEKRDGHLRSPDFFDAAKHPTIVFKSTGSVRLQKGKTASLGGSITIRGTTKPVTFRFTYLGTAQSFGKTVHAFSAQTKIDRQAFGVSWNKKLDTGGWSVGNEVTVTITGEAL